MLFSLLIEDHLDQEVGDLALRSPEAVCDCVSGHRLARGSQRKRDAGRPSFGALADERQGWFGQARSVVGRKLARLVGVKCKSVRAELEHIVRDAATGQRQIRVYPRHEHELRARWYLLEQEVDKRKAPRLGQLVEVVEDQLEGR